MLRKSTFMFINVRVEFFRKDLASLFMMTKSDAFACFRGLPFGFSTMSEKQSQKKADEFLIKELFFWDTSCSSRKFFSGRNSSQAAQLLKECSRERVKKAKLSLMARKLELSLVLFRFDTRKSQCNFGFVV